MSDERTEQSGATGNGESTDAGAGAAAGAGGAEGARLRELLAALGERLDRLSSSPEVQDARRKLAQAAEELETRLREAHVADKIEQGVREVGQRVSQAAETPRGREIGDRLSQAFSQLERELQDALESPRGQELRARIATFLRDLGDTVERGRATRASAGPAGDEPMSEAGVAPAPGEAATESTQAEKTPAAGE
jgi:hypothetical protein